MVIMLFLIVLLQGSGLDLHAYGLMSEISVLGSGSILRRKWGVSTGLPGTDGVLAADINGDGRDEVIFAGIDGVVALDGTSGRRIWSRYDGAIGAHAQPEMADLNRDGVLEVVVPLEYPAGLLVLHANDGSTYWRKQSRLGWATYSGPVILDIDGDGFPTIFFCSQDVYHGINGSGRITALSYDGKILRQTFSWRPCHGGLSIADTDGDGEFELYMGDRYMYMKDPTYGDNGYGKGVQSYWARNLTLRWCRPDIYCSSQKPIIVDANRDGKLDVVIGCMTGGVAVLNAADGSAIRMSLSIGVPTHYQPSVYDIDGDGNLEMLTSDGSESSNDYTVVWDLVQWKIDKRFSIGKCHYGPQVADVNGDGIMEIIAANKTAILVFNRAYSLIDTVAGLYGKLNYAVVQDIDGDGYSELVISSTSGVVYAFDTPARRPKVRPRTEVRFYSEYRRGAAEYVPPPQGGSAMSYLHSADQASQAPLSLPTFLSPAILSTLPMNLHFTFDDRSSTTVKDYSGYNNNGQIVRGVTWTNNGKVGGAYQFSRGLIQIPGKAALDGGGHWGEITVEHWIYLTASQSNTRTIARVPSYEIGISGNKLFAGVWVLTGNWKISGYNKVSSSTTLRLYTWYHVALTYKSGVGLKLYLNGQLIASKTSVTGNIQPSGTFPLYIGWFDYFKGKIDEVRIYPICLSKQQINQDYVGTQNVLG